MISLKRLLCSKAKEDVLSGDDYGFRTLLVSKNNVFEREREKNTYLLYINNVI